MLDATIDRELFADVASSAGLTFVYKTPGDMTERERAQLGRLQTTVEAGIARQQARSNRVQVVTETAPRALIREAILRIIPVIAGDITPQNISRRTLEYQAFRGILRFDHMRNVFGDEYEQIDSIYSELKPYCDQNFLYWLQRGRLEVHFDKFDTAQNYLNASLAIRDNYQAWHYVGVLHLKRAAVEREAAVAQELAEKGEAILRQQILERPDDAYPYAALIDHKLRYVAAHPGTRPHLVVRELYLLAQEAMKLHQFDEYVRMAHDQAWKATLAFPYPVDSQAKT